MTAIWAHRGASAYAPENTIPAIQQAIEMGADGVELDVQRTIDGQLVVIHDETINRTSNGFGRVADLTLEQLRLCNYSNGFVGHRKVQIPTLREVLELLEPTRLRINLELKNSIELYPGMENDALAIVQDAGILHRVLFSSFNHFSLANLRGTVPPECSACCTPTASTTRGATPTSSGPGSSTRTSTLSSNPTTCGCATRPGWE